jgi:hypothetical protein
MRIVEIIGVLAGVGLAMLIASNYQRCMGGNLPAGTFCANGQMNTLCPASLGSNCPANYIAPCAPATAAQLPSCLTSFFGGYQGGF